MVKNKSEEGMGGVEWGWFIYLETFFSSTFSIIVRNFLKRQKNNENK